VFVLSDVTCGRGGTPRREEGKRVDDNVLKRLLAIEVLLEKPDDISDGLEAELYALRDKLQVAALATSR
jgi:hypothetical protein